MVGRAAPHRQREVALFVVFAVLGGMALTLAAEPEVPVDQLPLPADEGEFGRDGWSAQTAVALLLVVAITTLTIIVAFVVLIRNHRHIFRS